MTEVFNAAEQPFDAYWNLLLPGAAIVATAIALMRGAARRWLWIGGGLAIFLFLLVFILPLLDHRHMQALAASPAAQTVEGVISGHKRETRRIWTGSSRGMGVTTSNSYRNSTEEQFRVGGQWFWFEVGGMPSRASFTNDGDPPLSLADGSRVRLTYVVDPWYQDQKRIVKLALRATGSVAAQDAIPDAGFAAFWRDFAAAVHRADRQAVQNATRFPFLFAGTPLSAEQFDRVWAALFLPPPLRQCLATAQPVRDGKGWSVSCGVYVYVFEASENGWRFSGFTADPEA